MLLTASASVDIADRDNTTYTHDFIRNLLGLSFPLLEVRTTAIKLGGVDLFIERGFDTKQFFIRGELIPATVGSTRAEGYVIAVCAKGYGGCWIGIIGSPSSQLPFFPETGLVADICVGLES